MSRHNNEMRMPELLVYARVFAVGLVAAEIYKLAGYGAAGFAKWPLVAAVSLLIASGLLCTLYVVRRGALEDARLLLRSRRVDLLLALMAGAWSASRFSPLLKTFHDTAIASGHYWGPPLLTFLLLMIGAPAIASVLPKRVPPTPQLRFLADEEIRADKDDLLNSGDQAQAFAETVMASGAHSSLVFGIDGPWGIGKTSFVNLAERYWRDEGADNVIIFRFEPLRYASEPDLAERIIRELSTAIQKQIYVPEFKPTATRYSRMLKGSADISFLGLKLTLDPAAETLDELLEDIDAVLKRVNRRVIIVVDDLDRLETKVVNNVLFTVRRTFKISQATYVLCYDTEVLAGGKEEGDRAREFLEKFVNVKLSLFVDATRLRDFLRRDWGREAAGFPTVPADTMLKLSSILSELADILQSDLAVNYFPLIGDVRKLKRFINALIVVQMEKTDLGKTDFNKKDLINLMLLHLNYPGIFRQIYAEETEGRSGVFSVNRTYDGASKFVNAVGFSEVLEKSPPSAKFLLEQLFDAEVLKLNGYGSRTEDVFRTRACFNGAPYRNLEKYLSLIVRFAVPEPRATFQLYQDAVQRIQERKATIGQVLEEEDFDLDDGDDTHDQLWRLLVNQSPSFDYHLAKHAIEALVESLPVYKSLGANEGLRQRLIYSLIILLDRAGGRSHRDKDGSEVDKLEISRRIFGEGAYQGKALLDRLVERSRGVAGWNDLMLFRLQCSADRQGQVFNVYDALLLHADPGAITTGLVSALAENGMREISQAVFLRFRERFIDTEASFFAAVDGAPEEEFLGSALANSWDSAAGDDAVKEQIQISRSVIKSFVIFQLANTLGATGSGVGCGYYDESGDQDGKGIAHAMNRYLFEVCFHPDGGVENALHFADYCLRSLTSSFFVGRPREEGYVATAAGIIGPLDKASFVKFWVTHSDQIKALTAALPGRRVVMHSYTATYEEDLPGVFQVLDDLVDPDANGARSLE